MSSAHVEKNLLCSAFYFFVLVIFSRQTITIPNIAGGKIDTGYSWQELCLTMQCFTFAFDTKSVVISQRC